MPSPVTIWHNPRCGNSRGARLCRPPETVLELLD